MTKNYVIDEYYEPAGLRRAIIYVNNNNDLHVQLWENGVQREDRDLKNHSLYYAKDCAENWVTRVIN